MILIGVDGADFRQMEPLLRAGRLPHLAALLEAGVRAPLKSMLPSRSPALWTSVATGKGFDKHGINDFTAPTRQRGDTQRKTMHMTSNMRRTKALWNIVSEQGKRVAFVGWWCTWPAEQVNGYMVSSYVPLAQTGRGGAPTKGTLVEGLAGQTWPPELYERLRPGLRSPESVTFEEARRFMAIEPSETERGLVKGFRWAFAADETYRNAALAILDDDPQLDLFAVYFNGVDVMGHRFWKYRDPEKQPALPSGDVARFAGVIDAYYAYIDASIGEILARRRSGDTILVISDHGFEDGNHKRGPDGIFIAAGANLDPDAELGEVRLIDVAPTILALLGLPGAADFDGRVLAEAFTPGWREAYPKQQLASYDTEDWKPQAPIEAGTDDELMDRLRALGYVE